MSGANQPNSLKKAMISGTGSCFPEKSVSNLELTERLAKSGVETNDEWIVKRTGIRERRISDPESEQERTSSLAARAGIRALEAGSLDPAFLDQIICATCTPDTLIPSTACWVQSKLKAEQASAFDVNAACSGFIYALTLGSQAIESGRSKSVLVIGADRLSSFTNWEDRSSCILFGDGAGAVLLKPQEDEGTDQSVVMESCLYSDGNFWELFYIEAGGSNQEVNSKMRELRADKMKMKGREMFKYATEKFEMAIINCLKTNRVAIDNVRLLIPHQANLRIIEAVAKKLQFPMERVAINIDRYGNTSSATVPSALDEAARSSRIKRGDYVLLAALGAGATYGAALIRY